MIVGPRIRRSSMILLAAIGCFIAATSTSAQRRYGGGLPSAAKPFGYNGKYDGRFRFARLKYDCFGNCYYYQGEPSWEHGYPLAEQNLMQIVDRDDLAASARRRQPRSWRWTTRSWLKYPVSHMTEGSFWMTNDKEAAALGAYLKKGGFLIADDFRDDFRRGSGGWNNFDANIQRAIPGAQWVDLHAGCGDLFHSFYEINSFDIIPQDYDVGRPMLRGLYEDNDPKKRLLVMANFNTDVSNWWEFAGQGNHIVSDANEAYKLGVNYIVYGMTH